MKKKVFIMITICILSCLFALSVGAVTGSKEDGFGDVTYVSGVNDNTTIKDRTSRVVLLNADGTYTTYPSYYISDVNLQWQGTVQYKFDALNDALGTDYDMDSIVRVEVLTDSIIINQNGGSYQDRKNLKEVVFPSGTQIKEIGGQLFKGSGIEKICIPSTITSIGALAFEACQSLKEVTFAEGFSMKSLPVQMFTGCTSLEKIALPDCVESIGKSFFVGCTSLREVRFGKDFKYAGECLFALCRNDMVIYAPAAFLADKTSISLFDFSYDSGNMHLVTLFFEGTREEAQALVDKSSHRGLKEATLVEWSGLPDSEYIPQEPNAWTIVYSYNTCAHDWKKENEIALTDFFNVIEIGKKCTKCGTIQTESTIDPLFVCLGYSQSEMSDKSGAYSIVYGYKINYIAFEEYRNACKETLAWGIVACAANIDRPLWVEDGQVTGNNDVLTARVGSLEPDRVNIKMSGITKEMNGKRIVLAIYVQVGEVIYYLTDNKQGIAPYAIMIDV